MNVIIPMGGRGDRFVNAGYKDPKPMIMVRGKRVVEYVIDMFDKDDNFILICNSEHLSRDMTMETTLKRMAKNVAIIPIPSHKYGPVYTVYTKSAGIPKDEPVIIAYCDTPFTWDYAGFKEYVKDKDGCLVSCIGIHPHSLSSTMWAHSKMNGENRVLEVKEKSCYTDNHLNEHASSGVYYFGRGEYIHKYFKQTIDEDVSYNGEFYITLVYNLLIRDGLSVYSYLNEQVLSFGTPCDVQNFEAWQTILDAGQVKNEEDLINCYRYWKKYRDVSYKS